MIYGIVYKDVSRIVSVKSLKRMLKSWSNSQSTLQIHNFRNISFVCSNSYEGECSLHEDVEGQVSALFQGRIYNSGELLKLNNSKNNFINSAELITFLYRKLGENFIQRLRGKFAFGIYDGSKNILILGRDRLGIEPLFYYEDEDYPVGDVI